MALQSYLVKEDLVHTQFLLAVAHLANISIMKKKKNGLQKEGVDQLLP